MTRLEYVVIPTALVIVGIKAGLVPIWVGVFAFTFTGIVLFRSAAQLLQDGYDGSTISTINPYQANLTTGFTIEPTRQNWNCRNCGGPNINQIRCEYCGMVKE